MAVGEACGAQLSAPHSRLQDWPDAIWRIVRETEEPDSPRYFTAYGRDVNVPVGRLGFDGDTRRLTYAAGSRGDAKTEAAELALIALLVAAEDTMSTRAMENALGPDHARKAIRKATAAAIRHGTVAIDAGPRGAKLHRIAHPCSECGMAVASGRERHEACPTSVEGSLF